MVSYHKDCDGSHLRIEGHALYSMSINKSLPMIASWLVASSLLNLVCPSRTEATEEPPKLISNVLVDVARIHHDSMSCGDTWDYIWADDDNLYTFGCDGRGYGKNSRNLNFNRLTGNAWNALVGSLVNSMDEYGGNGAYLENHLGKMIDRDFKKFFIPRAPNWKVTGADCIDGVIYAFVAENWYGNQNAYGGDSLDPKIRQTVNNMSLIKSTDKGLTWSRSMRENALHPMWTDKRFSTAFFFKFGRNGGTTKQDDQDKFVYAISNDGYWNCGSSFRLGRVPREKIGDLNAADWEYFSDGSWTHDLGKARPIPGFPNGEMKCTVGSPVWLPSLRRYVAVTWFDPGTTTKWHYPEDVTFDFYQAAHPWGPWTRIGGKSAMEFIGEPGSKRIHRWYGPSLSPKFIQENPDGSVTVPLLFSGQTWEDKPDSLYKNNICPVTFYTSPLPPLRETVNDDTATYSDGWKQETGRGVGDLRDDAHVTRVPGVWCEFVFDGEGIEILSEKFRDMGEVEVLLDGKTQGRFNLHQNPMPRLYQVPFYRNLALAKGHHTVRIVNRAPDGTPCIVDGFRVYGDR